MIWLFCFALEAGRHRIWRDELIRRTDEDMTAIERETRERAIGTRARQAAIFDAVLRLIERARAEFGGDAVWE